MIFDELKNLNQVWGNDSQDVNLLIINNAENVYNELIKSHLNPDLILPLTNGNIQFEWHNGNKSLELEFISDQEIHYFKYWSNEFAPEEDVLKTKDTYKIIRLVRYFLQ